MCELLYKYKHTVTDLTTTYNKTVNIELYILFSTCAYAMRILQGVYAESVMMDILESSILYIVRNSF